MFTGIVEEIGTIEKIQPRHAGAVLHVRCCKVLEDMTVGASISVNGVCLTAVEPGRTYFTADVSPETLRRTNLGELRVGSRVNLERPLTPGGRLGGHIVQGHIDATGEFVSLEATGDDNWWLTVRVPPELHPYVVFKGSIAIDGISLTIAAVKGDLVSVGVIPHTLRNTTLGDLRPGHRVNLEADILAKYVENLLEWRKEAEQPKSSLTVERLRELGY